MDPNNILLSTKKLGKKFGGIQAVKELDLDVLKGKITGLIGPNGAGKSTFFNLINGIIPPDTGEILYSGKNIEGLKPHKIADLGIARTFQSLNNFTRLSVFENIQAGIISRPEGNRTEEVESILDLLGLAKLKQKKIEEIPPVARRLVEVGRALISKPKLVLFDEIMAGFNEQEVASLIDTIRRTNCEEGVTFCIIGHTMRAIMSVSDVIVVMRNGTKFTVGTPDEIQRNTEVQKIYFGE